MLTCTTKSLIMVSSTSPIGLPTSRRHRVTLGCPSANSISSLISRAISRSACTLVLCCGQRQRIHCQCICQGWHAPTVPPAFHHKMSSSTQTAISALPRRCSCQKIFVVRKDLRILDQCLHVVADNPSHKVCMLCLFMPFVRAMPKAIAQKVGGCKGQFRCNHRRVASHNIDMAN